MHVKKIRMEIQEEEEERFQVFEGNEISLLEFGANTKVFIK